MHTNPYTAARQANVCRLAFDQGYYFAKYGLGGIITNTTTQTQAAYEAGRIAWRSEQEASSAAASKSKGGSD